MMIYKSTLSFLLILTLFSTSAYATSFYPEQVIQILGRHKVWQTIPYSKLPLGDSFQATPGIQKKWEFKNLKNDSFTLTENTKLSLVLSSTGDQIEWGSEQINLKSPIQIEKFIMTKNHGEDWRFELIGNDSFAMRSDTGVFNVIFTPEKAGKTVTTFQKDLVRIHATTAPLGLNDESFRKAGLIKDPTAYLHHDLSTSKEIWISPSFPKKYYLTLQNSLRKWNIALGKKLFQLNLQTKLINQEKCFSSNVLCVLWLGSEEIPWSGMMALTTYSFDPETGNIIGGVISVNNLAPEKSLISTPLDILNQAASENPGIKWIAEQYSNGDQFTRYLHPFASQSLEYFLLHEIGHFNGLNHNFAGSRKGTFSNPTESIMDYLPFPVNFKANRIGKLDLAMLDLIYRGKKPYLNYAYCEASQLIGPQWAPNCDQRDIGNTLDWYKVLGEVSNQGFLEPLNFVTPEFTQVTLPLAGMIAKYFNTDLAPQAKKILCDHLNEGIKKYFEENKIDFECPQEPLF